LTLRQPTERHGGNARFDEETTMVSKTLASLDAWLAEAERVLAEQPDLPVPGTSAPDHHGRAPIQLSLFEREL